MCIQPVHIFFTEVDSCHIVSNAFSYCRWSLGQGFSHGLSYYFHRRQTGYLLHPFAILARHCIYIYDMIWYDMIWYVCILYIYDCYTSVILYISALIPRNSTCCFPEFLAVGQHFVTVRWTPMVRPILCLGFAESQTWMGKLWNTCFGQFCF